MPLTNQQYDTILREYDSRRLAHIREMQAKLDRAYAAYPRLSEIDEEVVSLNMKKIRARLGYEEEPGASVDAALEELSMERKALLFNAGFKDGLIEPEYDCPVCKDTGYVDGKKCSCFIQAETELLHASSGLNDILQKENFMTFSLDHYPDSMKDPDNGRSAKEAAKIAYDYARQFADEFGRESGNIYFYGKTGVGKTFLAHCIAGALIEKGADVLWLSEAGLIELFEESQFRSSEEARANVRLVFDSDLLVIDDFGATPNNSFVSSVLLRCIEERQIAKKSTIITTNLSIEDLQDRYSDRIFSRIYSYYKKLYLFGRDIRIRS